MKYEIWHDEYKGNSDSNEYWHGIFYVPVVKKEIILEKLKSIRDQHKISYSNDVKFAGSLESSSRSRIISNQLQLFTHSLISKESKATTRLHNHHDGKRHKKDFAPYETLTGRWGCKFVLMKIPDNHRDMTAYPMSYAERVETTFRIAYKGGLHLLFTEPVEICGFYFDGYEHHTRKIDMDRITKGDFRGHVSFNKDLFVDDEQRAKRDIETKMILSVVDNAVGGLAAKIEGKTDQFHTLFPLENIIERAVSGKLNTNTNGRWYKSLSFSQMVVENNDLEFKDLFADQDQLSLF